MEAPRLVSKEASGGARTVRQRKPRNGEQGLSGPRRFAMLVVSGLSQVGSCPSIGQRRAQLSCWRNTPIRTAR